MNTRASSALRPRVPRVLSAVAIVGLTVAWRAAALQPVSSDEAQTVADRWVATVTAATGHWNGSTAPTVAGLVPVTDPAVPASLLGYVATVSPSGHVLVSGYRQLPPVKSYSVTDALDVTVAPSGDPASWVLSDLARAVRVLASAEAGALAADLDTADNERAWSTFLQRAGRGYTSGVPGIEFVRREALLDAVAYNGGRQAMAWTQGLPFNARVPLMRAEPEELWADLANGKYTGADDRIVYDADGVWKTTDDTGGLQVGLLFHDANGNDHYDAGEDIWRDTAEDGVYTAADDVVFAGSDGNWTTVAGTPGVQGDLYYNDDDETLDYTLVPPEEIWVDLPNGTYFVVDDGVVYDVDGRWDTTRGVVGVQTALFFHDADGDGLYGDTEDIWKDEPLGVDGQYDEGIDSVVLGGLDGDPWTTVDGTPGIHGNLYCTDADGSLDYTNWYGRATPGPVALALAQICRYWQWPDVGRGSYTYDWAYFDDASHAGQTVPLTANFVHYYPWSIMPPSNVTAASSSAQNAVAQLLYDLAVCFDTDFSRSGSSATLSSARVLRFAQAMRYNAQGIQHVARASVDTDLDWFGLLQQEIDAGRPLLLAVYTKDAGHAVVVDGYDTTMGEANLYMLHCNMGGVGGANTYYVLNNIGGMPGGSYGDEYGEVNKQDAVLNIMPVRIPATACAELFRQTGNADALTLSAALQSVQGSLGADRVVVLAHHAAAADPLYSVAAADRLAACAGAAVTPPTVVVNADTARLIQGTGSGTQAAYESVIQSEVGRLASQTVPFRVTGNCVLGEPPATPDGRPYLRADVRVSCLDEGQAAWDRLALAVYLVEGAVVSGADTYQWVVRDCVLETDLAVGSGETVVVNVPPMSPAAGYDLGNAGVVAVLTDSATGRVLQAALLQAYTAGESVLRNSPPVAPTEATVTLNPAGDQLLCSPVGAYDPDGERLAYVYDWYVDGIQTGISAATVNSPADWAFAPGQVWMCDVRVRDPYYDPADLAVVREKHESASVFSNPLLILATAPAFNSAPAAPTVVMLVPAAPTDSEDVVCNAAGATDADGDPVTYLFSWYKGGVLVPALTDAMLPAEQTAPGDRWECRAQARDVWGAVGPTKASATVTVGAVGAGTPSQPVYVAVSPATPSYTATIECSEPTGVVCPNAVDFQYHWWKRSGASWVATGITASAVSPDATAIGEEWRCVVYARNRVTGANGPAAVSNTVYIRNFAPTKPTPSVYPTLAGVDQDLVCNATGSVDPDGDAFVYHYDWLVDGESAGVTGQTVSAGVTASGQTWICRVYAQDVLGARSAIAESSTVHVGSRPTSPRGVLLLPVRPEDDSDLSCVAEGSVDPDGDQVEYLYEWYRNGLLVPDVTGPVVSSVRTLYGDTWVCVVRATDGLLISSPATSNSVRIGNQPPTVPGVSLSPALPVVGQALTCEITSASTDPEGDAVEYLFTWYRNDAATTFTGGILESGVWKSVLPAGTTQAGETWKCQVYAQDNPPIGVPQARGQTVSSAEVSFVSRAPTPPTSVILRPTAPKAGVPLVCTASGSTDPNGDAITYLYTWSRNGVVLPAYTGTTVPADVVQADDVWVCAVRARDPEGETSIVVLSNSVTVGNVTPSRPSSVTIAPNPAGVVEDLVCTAGGSEDPNGDAVLYSFRWYRNGLAVPALTDYRVPAADLQRGQTWYCEAWASDGSLASPVTASSPVTIVNLAPAPPTTVAILPDPATDVHDLICSASGASDPEGGAVTYTYRWFRNGIATALATQVAPAADTSLGEAWSCEVAAVDTEGAVSQAVRSEATIIQPPAPSDPTVTVSPADPSVRDDLVCTVEGVEDPLAGTLTSVFHWFRYRGGVWSEPGIVGDTVSSGDLQNGDIWRCAVYVVSSSGYRTATITSNEVTVRNHAPTPPTVVLVTPEGAVMAGLLTCTATGAVDRDGDALTTTYRWQVYAGNTLWTDSGDTGMTVLNDQPTGTIWRCLVRVSDGVETSPEVVSNSVIVSGGPAVAPTPPARVVVQPADAAAGEELVCVASGATDVNGDLFAYRFQWYRDEALQAGCDEPVLPAGLTAFGQVWRCDVSALDAMGLMSAAVSAQVTVAAARANLPTVPVRVAVAPPEPSYTAVLRCSQPSGVVCADAVAAAYRWELWMGDTWLPTDRVAADFALSADEIGHTWRCRARAVNTVTGAVGPSAVSNQVVVRNFAPSAPTVVVSPQFAALTDDLVCTASGSFDAEDGDALTYHFEWLVNGETTGLTGEGAYQYVLPAGYASSGETWTCLVYAIDSRGGHSATVLSANSVYIGSAPTPPERAPVEPNRPEDVDDITCTAMGSVDADGDAVIYRYDWYREEDLLPNMPVPTQLPVLPANRVNRYWKLTYTGALLPASMTSFGERWVCVVYASDGTLTSAPIGSEAVVVGNQPPSRPTVAIDPAAPSAGDAMTCQIVTGSVDPEGDGFSYTFRWFRDQETVAAFTGQSLPASMTLVHESWYCEVTVTDAWTPSAGNVVRSATISFEPVAPSRPTEVYIQPAAPKPGQSLTCVAQGAIDPSGGAVTYQYTWSRGGVVQGAYTTDTIAAGVTQSGEVWRCAVAAVGSGGLLSEEVVSSPVTVANLAPTAPTQVVVSLTVDLLCTVSGSQDPNGDAVTYLYQWYRNDVEVVGETQATVAANQLVAGDAWACAVRATDGDLTSDAVVSNLFRVANLPPSAPTAEAAVAAAGLTCRAWGSVDPEGGDVAYLFAWYRNGVDAGTNGTVTEAAGVWTSLVSRDQTAQGDQWYCVVRAVDDVGSVSAATQAPSALEPPLTIGNLAPVPPTTVAVNPLLPTVNNALVCQATPAAPAADADGDTVAYVYQWYRNGVEQAGATSPVMSSVERVQGDRWHCEVCSRDTYGETSNPVRSNVVVIGAAISDAFESDDVPSLAQPIASGVRQVHTFRAAGDSDWVTFQVLRPSEVRVAAALLSGRASPMLSLFDSQVVAVLAATGLLPDPVLQDGRQISRILTPGTYYVRAANGGTFGGTPMYSLDCTITDAAPIGTDLLFTGAMTALDSTDWVYLYVPAPQPVTTITAALVTPRAGASIPFTLYDDRYQVVATSTVVGTGRTSVQRALATGLYYLEMRGTGVPASGSLPYKVELAVAGGVDLWADLPPSAPTVAKLFPGEALEGTARLHAVAYGSHQADGAPAGLAIDYAFHWYQNGQWRPDLEGLDEVDGAYLVAGDVWGFQAVALSYRPQDATVTRDLTLSGSPTVTSNAVTIGAVPDWFVDVTVKWGTGDAQGETVLTVGQSLEATNGWDDGWDDVLPVLPPIPEAEHAIGYVAYLEALPGVDIMSRDVRGYAGTVQVWYVQVLGTDTVVFSWDAPALPEGMALLLGEVDDDGQVIGTEVDMTEVSSLDVGLSVRELPRYRIAAVQRRPTAERIDLDAGWNLISFTLHGVDDSVESVFGGHIRGSVWGFVNTGEGYYYQGVSTLETGCGYWVLSPRAQTVEHIGLPDLVGSVQIRAGWNLVGPVKTCLVPANTAVQSVYAYVSPFYYEATLPAVLVANYGYWLLATGEATLNLR